MDFYYRSNFTRDRLYYCTIRCCQRLGNIATPIRFTPVLHLPICILISVIPISCSVVHRSECFERQRNYFDVWELGQNIKQRGYCVDIWITRNMSCLSPIATLEAVLDYIWLQNYSRVCFSCGFSVVLFSSARFLLMSSQNRSCSCTNI